MLKSAEYYEVLKFLTALDIDPKVVESVHVDHDWITVIGFEYDAGKRTVQPEDGEYVRFVRKYKMENYAEDGEVQA